MNRPTMRPAPYLGSAYSEEAIERCGGQIVNGPQYEECIEEYWKDRIIKEFAEDFGYEPGYQNEYFNYLSLRVQKNVEEIIELGRKYPTWAPERYQISPSELEGYSFVQTDAASIRRYREAAKDINRDLEDNSYEQRLTVNNYSRFPVLFRNLRQFFDETRQWRIKMDEIWRDTLAASTILAEVVRSCRTCRALFVEIPVTEYQNLTEFFNRIQGIRPLTPELRVIFSKLNAQLGPATMLVLRHRGMVVYTLYIHDEGNKYELTHHTSEPDGKHLPVLFVNFLKSKGLVTKAAERIYPVFDLLYLADDDDWL